MSTQDSDLEQQCAAARRRRRERSRSRPRRGRPVQARRRRPTTTVTVHLDLLTLATDGERLTPTERELQDRYGPVIRGRKEIARLLGLTPAALSRRIDRGQAPVPLARDEHTRGIVCSTRSIARYYDALDGQLPRAADRAMTD